MNYISDKTFEKNDFSENYLSKGDYDNCIFLNCNFSNSDLSSITFSECEFKGCNLSMVKLSKTSFKDVKFKDCKILGANFENCNDFMFEVYFENCLLKLSSFNKLKLLKTKFITSNLDEVDFSNTDLTGSVFNDCDLKRTIFRNTILEKVDFRSSYNYIIDPEINKIKKAKFSLAGVIGLLDKYDIDIN